MTPERWRRLNDLFHAASSLPPTALDEFVRRECGGDEDLIRELRDLLAADRQSGVIDRTPWSAAAAFGPGDIVAGRYRIVRVAGRGGMGEVYEAEDLELNVTVALKTLLPSIAADERMVARFKQEIALSRKISHENVCRVFDLAQHPPGASTPNSTLFLTMEYLEGETLAGRLERDGPLTAAAALPILRQVAAGLGAAHRAGVIHRDLKPSNIMVSSTATDVRAVVTDFGLARSFSPSAEITGTGTGPMMGTLDYMAPELLIGGQATAASDVYALGMVAYRTVTGALPFEGDAPLAGAILRSRSPVPGPRSRVASLEPSWDRAILRALDADPGRRFASPQAFVEALCGDAGGISVPVPAVTRRKATAAAIVVVLAFAGWVGWTRWKGDRSGPAPEALVMYRRGVDDIHGGAWYAATRALERAVRISPAFVLAHARLAEAWSELEMPERAFQEMLIVRRLDLSGAPAGERLRIEGIDLTSTRNYPEAIRKFEQMRAAGVEDGDLTLARAYELAGGKEKVDKAVGLYRAAAEGSHEAAAWLHLATIYHRRGSYNESDAAFAQAEEQYKLTSNLEGLIELARQRAFSLDQRKEYSQAATYLNLALETARAAGNTQQEIRARIQFATHSYLTGDAAAAERYAAQAIESARLNQMDVFAARGLQQIGNARFVAGDRAAAERYLQESVDLARRGGSAPIRAACLLSLASVHSQLNRPRDARQEAAEALPYYEGAGMVIEQSQASTLIFRAARDVGDWDGAVAAAEKLRLLGEKTGNRSVQSLAAESMGSLRSLQERYPEALEFYLKNTSLATSDRAGFAHMQAGHMLWLLGRFEEAAVELAKAAEAAGADFAPTLNVRRAGMELSRRRPADAARLAREALAGKDKLRPVIAAQAQLVLGRAEIALGRVSPGLARSRDAVGALLSVDQNSATQARLELSQALIVAGDPASARKTLEELRTSVSSLPESKALTLALFAHVDGSQSAAASAAVEALRALWGDAAFQTYAARPDLQPFYRPFLSPNSAKH